MSVESRYRVGMAQYMLQNYDAATAAFAGSLAIVPQDDDMYIADVYWLVLSQLRAEKADEAQKTLKQHYRPDMYVGHHTAYEKAMRVAAAGFAPMEDMLAELDAEEDDLQFAMTADGLCVLLEAHSETEKADALRQKLGSPFVRGIYDLSEVNSLQRKVFTPGKCARGLGGAAHHRARRAQCSAGRTYHFSGI